MPREKMTVEDLGVIRCAMCKRLLGYGMMQTAVSHTLPDERRVCTFCAVGELLRRMAYVEKWLGGFQRLNTP